MSRLVFLLLITLAAGPLTADTASAPLPDFTATFSRADDGWHIRAPGYSTLGSPADPALPFIELHIILPPNADPASVTVSLADPHSQRLPGTFDIAPAPPVVTIVDDREELDWGDNKHVESGRNTLVYSSNSFFPSSNTALIAVGKLRQWQIARVRYYPYRYNPVSQEMQLTSSSAIMVTFRIDSSLTAASASNTPLFADKVEKLAANYSQARTWYQPPVPAAPPLPVLAPSAPTYMIITTSAISNGSSRLADFSAAKARSGFKVEVATENAWGGGTGDTAAEKIRAYLKSNYLAKGITYVLLIGNPNPAGGDVPMKMLWPRSTSSTYREAPSDYYYADLTGNWDVNRNGLYGEWPADFATGGVDTYPEVMVGRIPFYGSYTDLDSILGKIIDYESGINSGQWVRNVLLSMEPSDSNTPGCNLGEAIKQSAVIPAGFNAVRVYDQVYGLNPQAEYIPCDYNTVLTAWQQHAGFHFWWTHGSDTTAASIMSSDRCQYLNDDYPSFVFQASCSNGNPDNASNLGYSLLRQGAVATDSASRVSWYIPGQIDYTHTDTNAGMAYIYSLKLIRDHEPCGDAHYDMMVAIPNAIWMNHCVFNLYGDPSLAYSSDPLVKSTPLSDTDNTTASYMVQADVYTASPLATSYPCIKWKTSAGASYSTASMALVNNTLYSGAIPPQNYGTTVFYYVEARDISGRSATSPSGAPASLYSFRITQNTQPPLIESTPLPDTRDTVGPYLVRATITDNQGISSAWLHYNVNGCTDIAVPMIHQGASFYEGRIPGPMNLGDAIYYYITASDASPEANTSRSPSSEGYYVFKVAAKRNIAIYNCSTMPPYFTGGNANIYSQVLKTLNSDARARFQAATITSLSPINLANQDALILPDNAVFTADMQAVSNWFTADKIILAIDSSACYGAYSGWMWPSAAGTNGYATVWDYNSSTNDQEIWTQDPATVSYSVGQLIESNPYECQYRINKLPADAVALAGKKDRSFCYAAYRDVPGKGRFAVLGPYAPPLASQQSLIWDILYPPQSKGIRITAPTGGEEYSAGDTVTIALQIVGNWSSSEKIRLEYCTGLDDIWRPISGADSLACTIRSFSWSTAGLPGSRGYKVRAALVGGSISAENSAAFSIIPAINIIQAKYTPDGQSVRLLNKEVICSAEACYIEEPNRTAGIRIRSMLTLTKPSAIVVTGTMNTINGERVLDVDRVEAVSSGSVIAPWLIRTKDISGGAVGLQDAISEYRLVRVQDDWARQMLPALGLNNIGLLVRITGRVTSVGVGYFYVDDGSGCDDGSAALGVRVISGNFSRPETGSAVTVTGVCSTYSDRGQVFRALLLPSQSDWQPASQ